jgi:hypothetical protein
MYDDYDLDYTFAQDTILDLDEYYRHMHNAQDTYDLDEEYTRDSHDYNELAYRHYA